MFVLPKTRELNKILTRTMLLKCNLDLYSLFYNPKCQKPLSKLVAWKQKHNLFNSMYLAKLPEALDIIFHSKNQQ